MGRQVATLADAGAAGQPQRRLQRIGSRMSWLGRPITYSIAVPVLSALGAGTTVAMPVLLDPTSFGRYALLVSVLQYVYEFDFGLSRLSDRLLPQEGADVSALSNELLVARLYVAACIAIAAILLGCFVSPLAGLAAFAGSVGMLSNGPIAVYRARSQIARFTVASVATQFGLSLPRLAGVLLDGVRGCLVAFVLWYGMAAVVLYIPFLRTLRPLRPTQFRRVLMLAWPLFILSFGWLMYLLSSRWISWLISTPADAGMFAFGVNFLLIGVAVISVVAQAYYPRHLASPNPAALHRELAVLLGLATVGCVLADVVCRLWLARLFPHFADAASSTAATLFAGVPLSVCAWLIPLVIARSTRPLREALLLFAVALLALYGLMQICQIYAGIDGQGWACVAACLYLIGVLLYLVARAGLIERWFATRLWCACWAISFLCLAVWYGSFRYV